MTNRNRAMAALSTIWLAPSAFADDQPAEKDIRPSVVKIESTIRQPDLGRPWLRPLAQDVTGSGLVIAGKRILTNAHVVTYATQVTVQGRDPGVKVSARVEAIGLGIDLAVLKLEDEAFFEGKPPLSISAAIPRERESVLVYGFPTGGSSISVTKGIVSRVEFAAYDDETWGLRGQIDAAINPGNSGGPVVADGKLLGVAFSRLGGSDNIGYVIPAEEVALFLDDVKDGKYDGKPALFDELQTLENPAIRQKLKLPPGASGIIVNKPEPAGLGVESPLKGWDLITKIGDHAIGNTGHTRVGEGLDLPFQYYVPRLVKDGKVPLTVVREGRTLQIDVPVSHHRATVMPKLRGALPSYFIFGPLVFTAASYDLVVGAEQIQKGWFAWLCATRNPVALRFNDRPRFEGEQVVVVPGPQFTHPTVKGYSDVRMQVVSQVNGVAIKNLRHLAETIRDSKDDLIVIVFAGKNAESLVLVRKEAMAGAEEVLSDNSIRKSCSDDLKSVWAK